MTDEKNKNDTMQVHIVSSVKGGCGKTAFSLFKAMEMAYDVRKDDLKSKEAKVIWIDADFKGTASKALFYGRNEADFETLHSGDTIEELREAIPTLFDARPLAAENQLCFSQTYVPYTINDYLREDIRGLEKMVIHGYAYNEQKIGGSPASDVRSGCINGMIDFIFSSGLMTDKRVFNYGSGLPTIEIGRFTYLMHMLLLRLYEIGRTKTRAAGEAKDRISGYRHVVIDMPPGDDAYSSALLQTIRQLAREKKGGLEIHLYTMATSDRGHMDAMVESLKDTCERLRQYEHKEKIYAVLSEIREGEFTPIAPYKIQIDQLQEQMQKQFPNEEIEINTLVCKFQEEYYKFCRNIDHKRFGYSIEKV